MRKSLVIAIALAAAVVAVGGFAISGDGEIETVYRFATVEQGPLVKAVSASGELTAVVTVQVGSQISGQIKALMVDFNSEVRKDQVIARIDPESFLARVKQSEADLALALAQVKTKTAAVGRARADLKNTQAGLAESRAILDKAAINTEDAKLEFERKRKLLKRGVVAASQVDKARAAFRSAGAQQSASRASADAAVSAVASRRAQVAMALAEVNHAKAQVQKAEAGLNFARVDLSHTFIRSPVDGVVIDRKIDVGQTVAASLQAPTLFTIAQNLRQMQVETNIDEADIGQILPGQTARFSVDSFPDRNFNGIVTQIRKSPQIIQNVVTYTVVVTAENRDLKLLPGMTANVQVIVSQRENALKVPNAALRFRPPGAPAPRHAQGGAAAREHGGGPGGGHGADGSPGAGRGAGAGRDPGRGRARTMQRLEQLSKNLQLTAAQKDQVLSLMQSVGRRARSLRRNGLRGEEFRNTMRDLRRRNTSKIMALLNPVQKAKFRKQIAGRAANPVRRGQVWVLEDGQPKAVNVAVGVGDGAASEIVHGLTKDQKIIIGIKRQASQSRSGFRRFGF